jgi:hypothetical protein
MPAVAMAPAAEEALVAAAAVSLGAAELAELDSEWLSLALSVVLVHSAVKAGAVLLEHESPTVLLEPVAKLTAAHYQQRSAAARVLQMPHGKTYLVQGTIARVVGHLKDASLASEVLRRAQVVQAEDTSAFSLYHRQVCPVVRLLCVKGCAELPVASRV